MKKSTIFTITIDKENIPIGPAFFDYEKYRDELLKQRKEAKEKLLDNHDNYKECK